MRSVLSLFSDALPSHASICHDVYMWNLKVFGSGTRLFLKTERDFSAAHLEGLLMPTVFVQGI